MYFTDLTTEARKPPENARHLLHWQLTNIIVEVKLLKLKVSPNKWHFGESQSKSRQRA